MSYENSSPFRPLPWGLGASPYLLIAGPCSAESEEQTLDTARALKSLGITHYRASLWKPRTQPGGFEGVGYLGLPWLRRVQEELGLSVMTEVATAAHLEASLGMGIRHFWIGARTTSSPFAVAEVAESLRGVEDVTILVKNPINPDINLWEGALLRLHNVGVKHIGAIHRGFSTYGDTFYRNTPIWQIPIELKLRHPDLTIIVDPSHIAGKRALLGSIARTALEMNFDGLMIETHCQPDLALSDALQQINPDELQRLMHQIGTPCSTCLTTPEIDAWRGEINRIDEQILELLAERNKVSRQIGHYKRERNICILQPERYRELIRLRSEYAKPLGLNANYVHDLFSLIHEESIHCQQELLKVGEG